VDLKQVARELRVRYVPEGSVRKAGNRVRITGQLIDTASGARIWVDRFDGTLDDIFELQDRVASSVVGSIEPKLRQSEIERATRRPTEKPRCLRSVSARSRAVPEMERQRLARGDRFVAAGAGGRPVLCAGGRAVRLVPGLQTTNRVISDEEAAEGARLARQ